MVIQLENGKAIKFTQNIEDFGYTLYLRIGKKYVATKLTRNEAISLYKGIFIEVKK